MASISARSEPSSTPACSTGRTPSAIRIWRAVKFPGDPSMPLAWNASRIPRLVDANATNDSSHARRASPGGITRRYSCATRAIRSTSASYTAATSCSRVGKCRYNVPMPTPARRATASRENGASRSARAALAAATSADRFRAASARGWRALRLALGICSEVDKMEDPPFRVVLERSVLRFMPIFSFSK